MQQKLKEYISIVGLELSNLEIEEKFVDNLNKVLETKPRTSEEIEKLLTYKVPKLTPDGSCSMVDELDEAPYNLKRTLQENNFTDSEIYNLIYKLDKVVEFLQNEIGADWTGIYKKLNTTSGQALVKLAYRGSPSRAEFPLTKEFADHSNNSTVGLSGNAVLINNVHKHLAQGKPYYECDNKVQSELCVPIFSKYKEIIGIIDLESFQENYYDTKKIIRLAISCLVLSTEL